MFSPFWCHQISSATSRRRAATTLLLRSAPAATLSRTPADALAHRAAEWREPTETRMPDTPRPSQSDKATRFAQLHRGPAIFVMPNPWDAGTALLLAKLGFEALATSSAACAMALGRRDGEITRDEAIAHARAIVLATDLPVAADLENGFGHAPADAALTIRLAADVGLCGGSIEDASGDPARPLYDFNHAVERVAAAAEAARAQPFPFTLTARAENYLRGKPDLDDTIKRLQAFEKAGADVLFAPGLPDLDAVRAVCASLTKPVSFMNSIKGKSFSVAELQAAGVRRVSLATSLYRVAMAGLQSAAREVRETGTFGYLDRL
jgi:2-methylisocitrate lyase-like PEP mutase family enzyme